MWKQLGGAFGLLLIATTLSAQDINGDLNTNIGAGSTVDSNNASSTTNYNGAGSSPGSQPVPTAMAPTMMGAGGNDSCLIPSSKGVQISILGLSEGAMEQDSECNRRKDARLLGAPQTLGGLGLQVSGISIMCDNPRVFKAMALANTPCPIVEVSTGKLLIGKQAYMRMRKDPKLYIVGYEQERTFWNNLLYIGRKLPDAPEEVTPTVSLSDKFRTSSSRAESTGTPSSRRSNQRTVEPSE